ncbi:TFIIB-type zinc ribbon-containing protein [Thermococcus sp.]
MVVIIQALKCKKCGAPLDVSPEDIIVVCPYCGFPNSFDEIFGESNTFFVESLSEKEIVKKFWERMRKDRDFTGSRDKISIVKVEGFYIPLWFGKVKARGYVRYEVYEKRRGKKEKVLKHRKFNDTLIVCSSGRRSVYDVALEELTRKMEKSHIFLKDLKQTLASKIKIKPLKELDVEEWESLKLDFLNTEFGRKRAEEILLDRASDRAKELYVPEDNELLSFSFEGEVEDFALVFYPVWRIYYDFGGGTYFVAYDGFNGREIVALEPMRIWRKVGYLVMAIIGVIISGFFATLVGNVTFWRAVAEMKKGALIPILIVVAGLYFGYELSRGYGKKMSWDVRVER